MFHALKADRLPSWFIYPQHLLDLLAKGDIDYGPWQLLHGALLELRDTGLKRNFPAQRLVPFARRLDSDDVACFDASAESAGPAVKIIHDFCSPGWEDRGGFHDFNAWLVSAQLTASRWENEDALDLKKGEQPSPTDRNS
jgi:hypothetical protein